ncbi:unnamed protein product [Lampetra planeri]
MKAHADDVEGGGERCGFFSFLLPYFTTDGCTPPTVSAVAADITRLAGVWWRGLGSIIGSRQTVTVCRARVMHGTRLAERRLPFASRALASCRLHRPKRRQ